MTTRIINLRTLILLSLALTFAFLANFAYSQTWSEPDPGGPPNPNAAAPLNVSTEFQAKPGNIMTNELIADTRMRSDLYCDEAGDNCFTPDEVGAGGGGTTFQNVSCTARWQSFMSGPDTCSATCPTDTTLVGCAKTSSDRGSCTVSGNSCVGSVEGGGSGTSVTCQATCAESTGGGGGGTTLPDQSGNAGRFLTTDGSNLSWANVSGGGGTTLPTCSNGEVLEYQGGSWVCGTDDAGSGGPSLPLSCPSGQVLTGIASNGSAQCTAQVSECQYGGVTYTTGASCAISIGGRGSCSSFGSPAYQVRSTRCQADGSWSSGSFSRCYSSTPSVPLCGS